MKNTIKGAAKSKSIWLAGAVALLPQVIDLLPNLKIFLGEHYGLAFFCLSLLMGYIRYKTTTALEDK
jgi:hypothetical protein